MTAAAVPVPTAEQIATIDPAVDFDRAFAAGVTFAHRAAHVRTVACTRPRCRAQAGDDCRTPNGYSRGFHAERADLAYGRTRRKRPPRLTDRQAQWLEAAAESQDHRLFAPDRYATLSGDAADRRTADAMEAAGLIHQVGTSSGERIFELTPHGWSTYWTHRLVIRHDLEPLEHPATCPCRATRPATTAG